MKTNFSTRSFFLFLALSIASLPILLFGMSQTRAGLQRLVFVAAFCTLAVAVLAVFVAFFTIRSLNSVAQQVQGMSAVDLQPIELPDNALVSEEIRNLILNFNKLLQIGRA